MSRPRLADHSPGRYEPDEIRRRMAHIESLIRNEAKNPRFVKEFLLDGALMEQINDSLLLRIYNCLNDSFEQVRMPSLTLENVRRSYPQLLRRYLEQLQRN